MSLNQKVQPEWSPPKRAQVSYSPSKEKEEEKMEEEKEEEKMEEEKEEEKMEEKKEEEEIEKEKVEEMTIQSLSESVQKCLKFDNEESTTVSSELASPQRVTYTDILHAAVLIKDFVRRTSCKKLRISRALLDNLDVYFKLDHLQFGGSSKGRGVCYALLRHKQRQPDKKVISASIGNLAISICHFANILKVYAKVVIPKTASTWKIGMCNQLCGLYVQIIVEGDDIKAAQQIAKEMAKQDDLTYIGDDHPDMIAGQGTLGLEIIEDVPDIKAVIAPAGNDGLLAGVAVAFIEKCPDALIIGVESDACPSVKAALEAGEPTEITAKPSFLTEELTVSKMGLNAFSILNTSVNDIIAVQEKWIAAAIVKLIDDETIVVDGSGAVGLAAILSGEFSSEHWSSRRVVVALTASNFPPDNMKKCIQLGLSVTKCLLEFTVQITNNPESIKKLHDDLANEDVFIRDITYHAHNAKVVCMTKNEATNKRLVAFLNQHYTWSGFLPIFKISPLN